MFVFLDLIDPCLTGTWNTTQTIANITQNILSPLYTQSIPVFTFSTGTPNTVDCGARTYSLVPTLSFVIVDGPSLLIKV